VNRTLIDQLDELLTTLKSYCGHEIGIVESVSRSRDIGHDRHFSTRSVFFMRLREVGVAFSGTSLTLDGEVAGRRQRKGDIQNIRERNQGIERQQVSILDVPFSASQAKRKP
jgi:hypothetical protein